MSKGSSQESGDNLLSRNAQTRSGFLSRRTKDKIVPDCVRARRASSGDMHASQPVRLHLSPPRSLVPVGSKQESNECSNKKGLQMVSV
eukprot:4734593-Prymnesium_polylepis.1